MHTNEQNRHTALTECLSYTYIGRDGTICQKEDPVLTEHSLDVYINENLTLNLTCIPEYLYELVLGRLFTEGKIQNAEDVKSLCICESGRRANAVLARELSLSGCQSLRPVTPIPWKADWIFCLADCFADGMPLHGQTFATHSCFLAQESTLLFQCEDIGRHNALDKVIGYALRNRIDLAQCIVYSSGRIPTDMAHKAICAGIPILASKASPTQAAVELAQQFSLTLVCAARRDRMKLFAGAMPE
ncbi:MAG: formate dehydrogenase accessory sulfurtransferase FdhD [Eubacteriales bacterium]|nr:formate dehydrogenase accessory sulfurtransferase FdhD [Eubacteriales bacterium]